MRTLIAVLVLMSASIAYAQMATVVFYRPPAIYASGRRTTINVDGKKVCSLANGRFFKMTLPVGEHAFAGPEKKKGGKLTLEAGRVYYFATRLDAGFFQNA
jgi:hypothetical protein